MTAVSPTTRMSSSSSMALGVFSTGWSAIISVVSVRWYVGLLGIESYGLIGFFATLQAAIAIFELGLGATINREVARSIALDQVDDARRLLHSLEFAYWAFAAVVVVGVGLLAPLIAVGWLGTSKLPRPEIVAALRMMGVIAALRWPIGLYQGTLIGMHRAQVVYRMAATTATIANIGAVLILNFVHRSVWGYFVWQAVCALGWVLWARRSAWRELGRAHGVRFDRTLLRTVLVQSAMMSGVAVSGLVLTQLDKFAVSASTALADFGRYSLAGVLASGLSVLFIPTFNVIYPRLSALVATGDAMARIGFYRTGTRLFLSCLFPVALSAALYADDLLMAWTGNAALAAAVSPIATLLILGSMLNGVMHFPYALQLAAGRTRLSLLINLFLIAIMLPFTALLVQRYGAHGGGMAWLTLNSIYFLVGITVTHRFLLPGLQVRWLLKDVAPPFVLSVAGVALGHYATRVLSQESYMRLIIATVVALGLMAVLLFVYCDTRRVMRQLLSIAQARLCRRSRPSIA